MSITAYPQQDRLRSYNIHPAHALSSGTIHTGFEGLADYIVLNRTVCIDGYVGIDWSFIKQSLNALFERRSLRIFIHDTTADLKEEVEITLMVKPFLGDQSSVWGTRTKLSLADFFDSNKISAFQFESSAFDVVVILGPFAAAYRKEHAKLIYVDLPKSELQYRMRRKEIANLGATCAEDAQSMYKRFYFVDWVVLNQHKQQLLDQIDLMVDGQQADTVSWAQMSEIKTGLKQLSSNVFRVKPWFEPGAWGGQWMKRHMPGIDQDAVNYAWSFELIVPENGLVFESDGITMEISFDWLMYAHSEAVLGKHESVFGTEFPIRFDFLDTFDGGNLSIQCHPSLPYIREHFGERITQDETYYILDAEDDARVYIGFQEDINPSQFREDLEDSQRHGKEVDIEKYVQNLPSEKHDLFLIPNGTVHSAGKNNLVLEISATPYIFTFKMYDWLRKDLNGQPRPINIDHAFHNLNFERKGERVLQELKSSPYELEQGLDWKLLHLPTHPEHFYDVHQIVIGSVYTAPTEDVCHIFMLVEGDQLTVRTGNGAEQTYNYAETFVIPAAATAYELINPGNNPIRVVKAFLK